MTKLDERLAKIESLLEQILAELRGGKAQRSPSIPVENRDLEPTAEHFATVRAALRRIERKRRGKTK